MFALEMGYLWYVRSRFSGPGSQQKEPSIPVPVQVDVTPGRRSDYLYRNHLIHEQARLTNHCAACYYLLAYKYLLTCINYLLNQRDRR